MWRIIVLDKDGREVTRSELTQGELTIGRDQDRQVQLASASVSRRHAHFLGEGATLKIVDDGSANGVLVNGTRIQGSAVVDSHTKVEIAEFRLVVELISAEATPAVAPVTASVVESIRLVAQGGPYDAQVFPIVGEIVVGRAAECQLVLDDPSLSRKHANVRGTGRRLDVEDLGSSNGTFVNGRKVGQATAGPGDTVRFGELSFRIEDERGHGAPAAGTSGLQVVFLLLFLAVTVVTVVGAIVTYKRTKPVVVSGKDAIAKLSKQSEQHMAQGKQLFAEKKWADAKTELDAAIELDPANVEARRLKSVAARAPEDEKSVSTAISALALGDRRSLENALRLRNDLPTGSPSLAPLEAKLAPRMVQFGMQRFDSRDYADAAWALCRAFDLDPTGSKADARITRQLHEAERHLQRERGSQPCRAAK